MYADVPGDAIFRGLVAQATEHSMSTAFIPEAPASIDSCDASPTADPRVGWALACVLAICAVGAILAALSDGGYMDDEVTHYLIARTAWDRPALWLDEWGRPGFTVPYGLVAWIGSVEAGFTASRLLSVALLGASAWLTYRVARGLDMRYAWSAALLLGAMPLAFFTSYTPTTETIAAFYAIAATFLFSHGRRWAGAAVLALLPLTRHELIVFLVPVGLYCLWRRDWMATVLLAWAEIAWNVLTWSMSLYPPSGRLPIERYFATADAGVLGYGEAWHYVLRWLDLSGTVIVALAVVGALMLGRRMLWMAGRDGSLLRRIAAMAATRRRRVTLLIVGGALGMVVMQTVLYMVNTHLSGGYARFLIPAAPWMAICAATGVEPMVQWWRSGRLNGGGRAVLILLSILALISLLRVTTPPAIEVALGLLLIVMLWALMRQRLWLVRMTCVLAMGLMVCEWLEMARPHRLNEDQQLLRQTLADLRASRSEHYITGSSPWIQYFLDQPVNLPRWHDPLPWDPRQHPVQTLYVDDRTHGKQWVLDAMADLPHRQIGERSHPGEDEPYLRIYERLE